MRNRLIVVRPQADLPRVADATVWDDAAGAEILEYLDVGTTDVWAHIGTHSFSPFRSCFRKLVVAVGRDPLTDSAVELEATCAFASICHRE